MFSVWSDTPGCEWTKWEVCPGTEVCKLLTTFGPKALHLQSKVFTVRYLFIRFSHFVVFKYTVFLLYNLILTNSPIQLNWWCYLLWISGFSLNCQSLLLFFYLCILPEVSVRLTVFFETFRQIWIEVKIWRLHLGFCSNIRYQRCSSINYLPNQSRQANFPLPVAPQQISNIAIWTKTAARQLQD